jgi:hypothetical protein
MIKEFLADEKNIAFKTEYPLSVVRRRVVCNDGFSMSVQASQEHYCYPKETRFDGEYETTEVAFVDDGEEEILKPYFNFDEGLYPQVPVEVVDEIITKHGGIMELPDCQ